MRFTIDGNANTYEALAYGPRWNGWVTPVVTRDTLEQIARDADPDGVYLSITFDVDGVATYVDLTNEDYDDIAIVPDDDGHYDLSVMGWTFYDVDDFPKEG